MQNGLVLHKAANRYSKAVLQKCEEKKIITGNDITAGKVLLIYIKTSLLFHAAEEIENTLSYSDLFYKLLSF
jgi:hypothetical protein